VRIRSHPTTAGFSAGRQQVYLPFLQEAGPEGSAFLFPRVRSGAARRHGPRSHGWFAIGLAMVFKRGAYGIKLRAVAGSCEAHAAGRLEHRDACQNQRRRHVLVTLALTSLDGGCIYVVMKSAKGSSIVPLAAPLAIPPSKGTAGTPASIQSGEQTANPVDLVAEQRSFAKLWKSFTINSPLV